MADQKIAIIGGGPKAAAIAAKAWCLRAEFGIPLKITIFEPQSIGAHWTGECGYTDGRQRLCTPAEKDLGFPYTPDAFGENVANRMFRNFSWASYLVERGSLGKWVDRGRLKPSHKDFAGYLAHCIEKSQAEVIQARVAKLRVSRGSWTVFGKKNGATTALKGYRAVVVTGPGPASKKVSSISDPRVFNGVNFWSSLPSVEGHISASNEAIVIVGSGGTAAAIAGWLVSRGIRNEIFVMGNQASLFARVDNAFENAAFTDQELWESLSFDARRSFTDRLTRGAVWSTVIDALSCADNVSYIPGKAKSIALVDSNNPASDLTVKFVTSASRKTRQTKGACLVVDATGFDSFWFADLLEPGQKSKLLANRDKLQREMLPNLALPVTGLPPLHAPMLSQAVSPAFTSLMALGNMADAVLRSYVASGS